MFGIVIGVLGLVVAVYGLLMRETAEDEKAAADADAEKMAAEAAAEKMAAVRVASSAPPVPIGALTVNWPGPTFAPPGELKSSAAAACYVGPHDWTDTEAWTAKHVGHSLSLVARLALMRSVTPHFLWPAYARRIDCALKGS